MPFYKHMNHVNMTSILKQNKQSSKLRTLEMRYGSNTKSSASETKLNRDQCSVTADGLGGAVKFGEVAKWVDA